MAHELRVRPDFVSGVVDDAPLLFDATTLNASLLSGLQTIGTTQQAVIILDPLGAGNGPEIAYVTAHTSGAGAATLVRGREGTTGVEHAANTPWVIGPTVSDFTTMVATRSGLPNSGGLPYPSQVCYIIDEHALVMYDGTAWKDLFSEQGWTSFSTTFLNGWAASSQTLAYRRSANRTVSVMGDWVVSAAGGGGELELTAPFASNNNGRHAYGHGFLDIAATQARFPITFWLPPNGTTIFTNCLTTFGGVIAYYVPVINGTPHALVVGDRFHIELEYEAAAG